MHGLFEQSRNYELIFNVDLICEIKLTFNVAAGLQKILIQRLGASFNLMIEAYLSFFQHFYQNSKGQGYHQVQTQLPAILIINNLPNQAIESIDLICIHNELISQLYRYKHFQSMDNSNQDIKVKAFKVILVGPQAVGKSSILFRLSESKFNTAYLSTVGIDFKTYTTQVGQLLYSLQIWDTAGQQKFRALTSTYYKGSQGCICVFDLSDPSTIERCDYYVSKALEENVPKECIYLVGNKIDITHENSQIGKEFARKYEVNYQECSAKEGTKVVEIFDALGANLVRHFGGAPQQNGEEIKPTVNIKQGKRNCCGG